MDSSNFPFSRLRNVRDTGKLRGTVGIQIRKEAAILFRFFIARKRDQMHQSERDFTQLFQIYTASLGRQTLHVQKGRVRNKARSAVHLIF